MKKIYTLAAAALVALSAAAQDRTAEFQTYPAKGPVLTRSAVRYAAPFAAPAVEKAPSIMDYDNTFAWSFKRHSGRLSSPTTIKIKVLNAETGEVQIEGMWDQAPIPATIDLKEGTFIIKNKILLKKLDGEDVYFYLKSFNEFGTAVLPGASDAAEVEGVINDDSIIFPADAIFTVGDPDKENLGYYLATSQNEFKVTRNPEDEGWTKVGMATLQDGWLTPAFGADQRDKRFQYQVELQQNDQYNTIYRLVNPYRGNFPFAEYNESTAERGYIVFDIYYPDNVYFQIQNAGFAITDPSITITSFYCYNLTTFYMQRYDKTPAEVKQEMGADMQYTTWDAENRVLTIPSYYVEGQLFNETMWGDQTQQGSGWEEDDGTPVNMETKIWFPGAGDSGSVGSLESDSNAPVRYFNLQGVEVFNPSEGIFIRKQGGKVTKEVIR